MKRKAPRIASAGAAMIAAAGFILMASSSASAQLLPPYTVITSTPQTSTISSGMTSSTNSTTTASTTTATATINGANVTSSTGTASPVFAAPLSTSSTPSTTTAPSVSTSSATGGIIVSTGMYLQISGAMVTNIAQTASPATITAAGSATATCTQFPTGTAKTGTAVACPTTPASTSSSSAPYTVIVNSATKVLFNDRTPATLSDIVAGDTVNVYGFYNGGTIDAEILRDTSRNGSAGVSGGSVSPGLSGAANASLQAELDRLKALVLQLAAEVGIISSSTVNSSGTTY